VPIPRDHLPSAVLTAGVGCLAELCRLTSVAFDAAAEPRNIEEFALRMSYLRNLIVPKSVKVIRPQVLASCWALGAVAFETGSALCQVGCLASSETALGHIILPRSVATIYRITVPEVLKFGNRTTGPGTEEVTRVVVVKAAVIRPQVIPQTADQYATGVKETVAV
jgi:hypothetical protein